MICLFGLSLSPPQPNTIETLLNLNCSLKFVKQVFKASGVWA